MKNPYAPKLTTEKRMRCAAMLLCGCSLNGIANYAGISRKYTRDLLKSSKIQAEIERLGERGFIEEYAIQEDVAAIKANSAKYAGNAD